MDGGRRTCLAEEEERRRKKAPPNKYRRGQSLCRETHGVARRIIGTLNSGDSDLVSASNFAPV